MATAEYHSKIGISASLPVAATATFTFTDTSDAAGTYTDEATITLIDSAALSKTYKIMTGFDADDADQEFNSGATDEISAANFKAIVEGSDGHNGTITVTVSGGQVTLTQATTGTAGNSAISTSNWDNNTSVNVGSDFTGGMTSVPDCMYGIYSAIAAQVTALGNNKVVDFVVEGSTTAVYNGSSFATPANKAFFDEDGSFLVVEPTMSYPGSGKWQLMIVKKAGGVVHYRFSPTGDYTTAAKTFTSNHSGDVACFGARTDVENLWVSVCNRDTYDSGSKGYSYIRVLAEPTGSAPSESLYVGGYIPFQPAADTKPVVAFSGTPNAQQGNDRWNVTSSADADNQNRCPVQYDHAAAMSGTSSKCRLEIVDNLVNGYGKDRSGKLVATSPYVTSHSGHALGAFGTYTMKSFETTTAWTADSSAEYITALGLLHRWKDGATIGS